jgi:tetratricopeptide (TPR) repeat protein
MIAALPLVTAGCHMSPRSATAPVASSCDRMEPGKQRLRACQAVLQHDSTNVDAMRGVALSLASLDRYTEALPIFEALTRLHPDDFQAQYGSGVALSALARYEEALASFRRAAEIDPDNAASRLHVGVELRRLNRATEAMDAFREAARRDPENTAAWGYLAVCAAELQRPAEAVSYWERAQWIDIQYFDMVGSNERDMYEASLKIAGPQQKAEVERYQLKATRMQSALGGNRSEPK